MAGEELEPLLESIESDLEIQARQANVRIDDSLVVGLINYAQHLGVRDLPITERLRVLRQLGAMVIEESREVADGAGLGNVILRLGCNQAMGNCKRAAEAILGHAIDVELPLRGTTRRFDV